MDVTLTSDIRVELVDSMGGDRAIAAAAWETTRKDAEQATEEEVSRLLSMLVRDRHGSVMEFGAVQFRLEVPIFVLRQWMRHRVMSYSEASGRWHRPGTPPPLRPVFWVPRRDRPMVAAPGHSPTRPAFDVAAAGDHERATALMHGVYWTAWRAYAEMLRVGIAAEVARAVLPLATYTTCRVQCNPRSLMHFLSLRTHDPGASVASHPQLEIEEAARQCEEVFKAGWPLTWKAWQENGRVAP